MAKNVTSADIFGGMFQNLPDYATKREEISENKEKKRFVGARGKKIRRGNDQTGTTDNIS